MKRKIITEMNEAIEAISGFDFSCFAIDTESDSLDYMTQKLIGISLCNSEENYYFVIEHQGYKKLDKEKLLKMLYVAIPEGAIIIAHNMVFDYKLLKKEGLDLEYFEWFDTMVAHHLLDENNKHGLKHLVKTLLGVETPEWVDINKVNLQEFGTYALDDTKYTWELMKLFKPQLEDQKLTFLFRKIEMPFLRALAEMESEGVLVDKDKVLATSNNLKKELLIMEEELYKILNEPYSFQLGLNGSVQSITGKYNFNSSKQLGDILFNKLNLPVVERTERQVPKTGAITIKTLKDKHPFVTLLNKYKIANKLQSAFFNPLPHLLDQDSRVRTSFHDVGTVTGRLSSSKPNLQQLPKSRDEFPIDTRSCFIASEGKKMVAVDYSQQELRIMTQLTKDETMIKAFKEGLDLHLYIANKVFELGIPEEHLYNNHPEHDHTLKKYKKERDKGKTFSFGIPYGMGANGMASRLNISVSEAERLLAKYYSEFPRVKETMDKIQKYAEKDGYVYTFVNRRRRFPKTDYGLDSRSIRQSFNFMIQSFGADLVRVACNKLYSFSKRHPEYGIKLLMTVHDEIVFECYEEHAERLAKFSEKVLESCGKLIVPLLAEANVGNNYGEIK